MTDDEDDPSGPPIDPDRIDPDPDGGVAVDGVASDLDPRVAETLRRVFGVPGVVGAKVWSLPDRMYVGLRIGFGHGVDRVLDDVRRETLDLTEPGEVWEFGQLDGD